MSGFFETKNFSNLLAERCGLPLPVVETHLQPKHFSSDKSHGCQRKKAEFLHQLSSFAGTCSGEERELIRSYLKLLIPRNVSNDKIHNYLKCAILEVASAYEMWAQNKLVKLAKNCLSSDDKNLQASAVLYLAAHPAKQLSPYEVINLAKNRSVKIRETIAQFCLADDEFRIRAMSGLMKDPDSGSYIRTTAFKNVFKNCHDPKLAVDLFEDFVVKYAGLIEPEDVVVCAEVLKGSDFKVSLYSIYHRLMFDSDTKHAVKVEVSKQASKLKMSSDTEFNLKWNELELDPQVVCRHALTGGWLAGVLPANGLDPLHITASANAKEKIIANLCAGRPHIIHIAENDCVEGSSPNLAFPETYVPQLLRKLGIECRKVSIPAVQSTNQICECDTNIGFLIFKRESRALVTFSSEDHQLQIPSRFRREQKIMGILKENQIAAPDFLAIGRVIIDSEAAAFSLQRKIEGHDARASMGGQILLAYQLGKYLRKLHDIECLDQELLRDNRIRKEDLLTRVKAWAGLVELGLPAKIRKDLNTGSLVENVLVLGDELQPSVDRPRVVHTDAHFGNVIESRSGIHMVDWEYSGTSLFPESDFRMLPPSLLRITMEGYTSDAPMSSASQKSAVFFSTVFVMIDLLHKKNYRLEEIIQNVNSARSTLDLFN